MEISGTRYDAWMDDALCLDYGPDLFYPYSEKTVSDKLQIMGAKAICELCPVKSDCLEYALKHEDDHGVWGGTTAGERRRISKQRKLGMISSIPDQAQPTDVI